MDAERRSRLLGVKLKALAAEALGLTGEPGVFPGGAAVQAGGTAVVLLDEQPARGLGRALAWARQAGAATLHVLVDDEGVAGDLARRAGELAAPPSVWAVDGRSLHAVGPAPRAESPPPPVEALDLAPLLVDAGCVVVVEHGEVGGEVLGLEVAKVVLGDGFTAVQAGIGRHDREAFAMVHGDLPPADALAKVVRSTQEHRRADLPDHPLHRLAAERWLREVVLAHPEVAGLDPATPLERHEGPAPRPNVRDPWPAVAVGPGVVVVTSVGIDLDLVPYAADARLAATGGHDARLVLAVPSRDAHAVTGALAAALDHPAEVVEVADGWRGLLP